MFEKKTILTL